MQTYIWEEEEDEVAGLPVCLSPSERTTAHGDHLSGFSSEAVADEAAEIPAGGPPRNSSARGALDLDPTDSTAAATATGGNGRAQMLLLHAGLPGFGSHIPNSSNNNSIVHTVSGIHTSSGSIIEQPPGFRSGGGGGDGGAGGEGTSPLYYASGPALLDLFSTDGGIHGGVQPHELNTHSMRLTGGSSCRLSAATAALIGSSGGDVHRASLALFLRVGGAAGGGPRSIASAAGAGAGGGIPRQHGSVGNLSGMPLDLQRPGSGSGHGSTPSGGGMRRSSSHQSFMAQAFGAGPGGPHRLVVVPPLPRAPVGGLASSSGQLPSGISSSSEIGTESDLRPPHSHSGRRAKGSGSGRVNKVSGTGASGRSPPSANTSESLLYAAAAANAASLLSSGDFQHVFNGGGGGRQARLARRTSSLLSSHNGPPGFSRSKSGGLGPNSAADVREVSELQNGQDTETSTAAAEGRIRGAAEGDSPSEVRRSSRCAPAAALSALSPQALQQAQRQTAVGPGATASALHPGLMLLCQGALMQRRVAAAGASNAAALSSPGTSGPLTAFLPTTSVVAPAMAAAVSVLAALPPSATAAASGSARAAGMRRHSTLCSPDLQAGGRGGGGAGHRLDAQAGRGEGGAGGRPDTT